MQELMCEIDWSELGVMLTGVGTGVLSAVAFFGLMSWKRQHKWEKRRKAAASLLEIILKNGSGLGVILTLQKQTGLFNISASLKDDGDDTLFGYSMGVKHKADYLRMKSSLADAIVSYQMEFSKTKKVSRLLNSMDYLFSG